MRSLAFLVVLALAGCAGAPPDAPGTGDEEQREPVSVGDASSIATTPDDASETDPSGEPPSPRVETPVRIEGSTAAGGCAVVQCHYEMTDTAFNVLQPDGGVRLAGTLTWDAVSPTSQQLTLYVPTHVGGEYHWEPGYPSATGASPLAFDLDLAGLGGVPLGLIVGNGVAAGTPAGGVAVQTPQAFLLEAVYTTVAA